MLPVDRLKRAGATDAEIAKLQTLDPEALTSLIARLESIVTQDISEWLEAARKAGHFIEGEVAKVEAEVSSDIQDVVNLLDGKDKGKPADKP